MKNSRLNHILFILLFTAVIFYYELVFKLATLGGITFLNILFWLLFGIVEGSIGYLVSSISKNPKVNKIITGCLLGLSALPFLIQFFVFESFNLFYDLTTMAGGAKGVASSYGSESAVLIFSPKGILIILLFVLPTALYFIFSKKLLPAIRSTPFWRIISSGSALLSLGLAFLIIFNNTLLLSKFKTEYHYQNAVDQFGLLPGMALDIKNIMFPRENEFVKVEEGPLFPENVAGDSTDISVMAPVGDNKIDLDFEALSKGANSEIIALNKYVESRPATEKNIYTGLFKNKNLIFITAEAFSAQVIDKDLTPTLYRLANNGINFTDFYQINDAGTTGGEYMNLFGMLPMAGGNSFKNTQKTLNYYTMGSQLNRLGYYGKAYHNNTYTFYDRHLTHVNLGYSDGYMGYGNGMEKYVKKNWPQSDCEMIKGTLPTYIDKEHFNIYYMSVSGHNNYTRSGNSMTARHWDRVKDLDYSDTVKGYLAANLDLEDGLTHLVSELEKKGIADDTVIVIASDHFPYGLTSDRQLSGEDYLSELYGHKVENSFDRERSRLIIWSGCLEDKKPIVVSGPTSSLDILPTLSNLFGTEFDSRLMAGRDVFSKTDALVYKSNYSFKTSIGTYYSDKNKFIPASDDITVPDGYVSTIKGIIANRIKFCTDAPKNDYFKHIFG